MIRGEDVRRILHAVSLEPGATADEKHRLGQFTYYLTAATAQDIADRLNAADDTRPLQAKARDRRPRKTDRHMDAPTHTGMKRCVVVSEVAVHTITLEDGGSFAALVHSNPGRGGEAYIAIMDRSDINETTTMLRNAIDDADLIDAGLPPIHAVS